MIDKNDFVFLRIEDCGHGKDYHFKVRGKTSQELTEKYCTEQGAICVSEVCYGLEDGALGIKIEYIFNAVYHSIENDEIKAAVKE